ncbi:uncharacterized protein HD556DRAFT_1530213 [Suillus plorans]|uniref:Inhibitor I9 domain-containing protein n=1 Tax=Suillus plorans TaxID=116603 RepID=A0A9P7AF76_9AGAM|nr:uncharacterized protein HD556DRAFT_1530213 [Suillus plorans]KAG1788063.1 hypothetical protein HD556DRAFT_1530213 [Suillus plorans]
MPAQAAQLAGPAVLQEFQVYRSCLSHIHTNLQAITFHLTMPKFIVSLQSGADIEAAKRDIEKQGGVIISSLPILGMITVQMSDEAVSSLKSLNSGIASVELDQVVRIQT